MLKETIICIVALIIIVAGNYLTNLYANNKMDNISTQLGELRQLLTESDVQFDSVKSKMDNIFENWKGIYEKLAYFIEHDELEKVEIGLTETKGNIEMEEYNEAVVRLDYSDYIITHIEDKLDFRLDNIF